MDSVPQPPTNAQPTTTASPRLAYLDATRAFALLLGVVFHASLSFVPVFIGWAVQDISTSWYSAAFATISHSFRMELFFLLAGFFGHMTLHRKGLKELLTARSIRIVIPFIVGWFFLQPLVASGWTMGAMSMRGDYEFWASLALGFQNLKNLPKGLLVGTHLWFLYYLIIITGLTVIGRALISSWQTGADAMRRIFDKRIAWLADSPWALPAAVIPISLVLDQMSSWGVDATDESLVPNLTLVLLYGGFFSLGWLLNRQPQTITHFAKITWWRCTAALLAIVVTVMLFSIQLDPGHPQYRPAHLVFNVSYALMMWTLVWLTIGIFRLLCHQPNKVIRYFADSSYWMYLIHLPLVIWLQVAVAELPLHWSLKLGFVSSATISIGLLTYDLFVRSTFIGHTLSGRRQDRVIFTVKTQPLPD